MEHFVREDIMRLLTPRSSCSTVDKQVEAVMNKHMDQWLEWLQHNYLPGPSLIGPEHFNKAESENELSP